ncbi:MAG: hypothetical protein R2942_08040 [Ignavibacteria bacterium]
MDGVVVKVNSFEQQDILGSVSKSPRWAVAYKFKAKETETKLNRIYTQVGRTGTLSHLLRIFSRYSLPDLRSQELLCIILMRSREKT